MCEQLKFNSVNEHYNNDIIYQLWTINSSKCSIGDEVFNWISEIAETKQNLIANISFINEIIKINANTTKKWFVEICSNAKLLKQFNNDVCLLFYYSYGLNLIYCDTGNNTSSTNTSQVSVIKLEWLYNDYDLEPVQKLFEDTNDNADVVDNKLVDESFTPDSSSTKSDDSSDDSSNTSSNTSMTTSINVIVNDRVDFNLGSDEQELFDFDQEDPYNNNSKKIILNNNIVEPFDDYFDEVESFPIMYNNNTQLSINEPIWNDVYDNAVVDSWWELNKSKHNQKESKWVKKWTQGKKWTHINTNQTIVNSIQTTINSNNSVQQNNNYKQQYNQNNSN